MNLMTVRAPRQEGGALQVGGARIVVTGPGAPAIRVDEIAIADARLRPVWGDRLYRVVLTWSGLPRTGDLRLRIME